MYGERFWRNLVAHEGKSRILARGVSSLLEFDTLAVLYSPWEEIGKRRLSWSLPLGIYGPEVLPYLDRSHAQLTNQITELREVYFFRHLVSGGVCRWSTANSPRTKWLFSKGAYRLEGATGKVALLTRWGL